MKNLIEELFYKYDYYKNKNIQNRRFKHTDFVKELDKLPGKFEIRKIGTSFENRDIFSVKIGLGKTKILFWSQMHGNESTATLSILDIFNFLSNYSNFDNFRNDILRNFSLYFVPMLNPDGAEKFNRRNSQDIDLNRDAIKLTAPESQILKNIQEQIKPDFAFNLHDQELYYGVGNTNKASSLAFLSPSYNTEKETNNTREKSMKLIAELYSELQKFIPGQIAKYNDSFMSNAFGDNFQKWGTSTILIESGYYKNDNERQFIRKLNFVTIIYSLFSILSNSYNKFSISDYQQIPENRKDAFFDYLIKNLKITRKSKQYIVDIGISRDKSDKEVFTDYKEDYLIWEIGDLSNFYGHNTLDANFSEIEDNELNICRLNNANFLIKKYFS